MKTLTMYGTAVVVLALVLAAPAQARAQTKTQTDHDSIWNGALIGAGAGAVVGLAAAPRVFCQHDDPVCDKIVRVVLGVPSILLGMAAGALVDGLHHQRRPAVVPLRAPSSLNVTFRF
jgi:hypothetical protein